MQPRITVITLCVEDLERSVAFYRDGLRLKTEGIIGTEFEHGAVAFFDLQAGLKLALWPRTSLAHDAGLPLGTPSATELSLGHNVASRDEVDAVMEEALRAEECISYQLPAFHHNGMLVGFGATANHCAFYLMSGSTVEAHQDELVGYDTSRGTIRFQVDRPLPAELVQKLVQARIAENERRRRASP